MLRDFGGILEVTSRASFEVVMASVLPPSLSSSPTVAQCANEPLRDKNSGSVEGVVAYIVVVVESNSE